MKLNNLRHIVFVLLLLTSLQGVAQRAMQGRIFDATNKEGLVGAVIMHHNDSSILAISDDKGSFKIDDIGRFQSLLISHLGYHAMTVEVKEGQDFLYLPLSPDPLKIEGVVVNAYQGSQELLNVPGAVTVITKKDLERDNEVIITPVLNRVPGVYMHSGTLNTNRITIRGIGSRSLFSTNKVRAYFNDIPLTSGEGETTLEDIDLSLIQRVDVIKGPASSVFGAGLGGTINLITKTPVYQKTSIRSSGLIGSYGLFRNVSSFNHSTDDHNISITYNKVHSDGYRENNEYDRSSVTALGEFYGNKNVLSVLASLITLKGFIPSSIDSATFFSNPQAAAFTWRQSMGFEDYDRLLLGVSNQTEITDNLSNTTSLFTSFRNSFEPRPFNILAEKTQAVGVRSVFAFGQKLLSRSLKWTLGGEYFIDWHNWQTYENNSRVLGAILSDNNEQRNYFNLFAQFQYSLSSRTTLSGGVNLNQTTFSLKDRFVPDSIDQSGKYEFDAILSPRIAISHQVLDNLSIYANISHGFSTPTLDETLTPDGLINLNIQPETGYNFEIGSKGSLWQNKLYYDLAIYSMRIRNLLVARRTAEDAFIGINAGKTKHNGVELNLNYYFIQNSNNTLNSYLSYTLADYSFDEFVDGESDFSGNDLTGTPSNVLNIGVDFSSTTGFYGNANFQFVDEAPITDANTVYSNSYSLVNLKAGFRKSFGRFDIDFYGGLNNLFDEHYASMLLVNASSFGGNAPRYFYPGLPRNYYIGLSLGFQLKE
ncbi:TonB-dependent receptor [Fulvivirgaceae bacterium BMA10]|uniref:TonB-dependent receptor n=1 Tax=Splendidivirga corallicola TaxID=3051826 RepID=A0ABT8KWR7_9BACT|nr:TonB-dependent receptor [Fulvivirgaceae bacterium BMA10]